MSTLIEVPGVGLGPNRALPLGSGPGHSCLRARSQPPEGAVRAKRAREETGEEGKVLACARCRRGVTTRAARIEVGGAHEHSFVNPAGLRFHIGCFAHAGGCLVSGEPSLYWTWFPSYHWQIEQCSGCAEHLGWLFRRGSHHFHGLILDRLVEIDN